MSESKEEERANDSEKFANTFSNTEATFTGAKLDTVLAKVRSGEYDRRLAEYWRARKKTAEEEA